MSRRIGVLAVSSIALAALAIAKARSPRSPASSSSKPHYRYEDIARGPEYPAPSHELEGAVLRGDIARLRRHAWSLWEGVTALGSSTHGGQRLPTFETWYSIPEVFNPRGPEGLGDRALTHPFRPPTQKVLAHGGHREGSAGVMSFVKYDASAAAFIWDSSLHRRATLDAMRTKFDADRTPVVERSIAPFPNTAVALKLVFWLVKDPDSKESDAGLTGLPIWDATAPPPPDGGTPMHTTWRRAVAVDPGARYPIGSRQRVNIAATATSAPRFVDATVVRLDRFYSHRLTSNEEVLDARTFMTQTSLQDEQERFVTTAAQTPAIGDFIVLVAMHLTTKEMSDWTFQTFWWTDEPDAAPFGHDRPKSVPAPFASYAMCTAYSAVSPRGPGDGEPVCFNPYLETDLGPTKPYAVAGRTFPPNPMAGTRSNCMNCHRRAGYPAFDAKDPTSADFGHVANDGWHSPGDAYFAPLVKTDFLWSIPLKATP